jgi:uncharacterized protein
VPKVALTISVLPDRLAVCRIDPRAAVPEWATGGSLCSVTRTRDELSIVCHEEKVPPGVISEPGWRVFKLEGPFNFGLTGILRSVAVPLAEAGISIFTISTYDTDYVLVLEPKLEPAIKALSESGHLVRRPGGGPGSGDRSSP